MDWRERIERKPEVMGGKPVVKGTRITVEHILERLGAGWTIEQLLESYPHLSTADVQAAQAFAAAALSSDHLIVM